MLIPVAPAKDESSYINGEHRKVKSARIARGFCRAQITRKSAADQPKIIGLCKLVLDTFSRSDIGAYHEALLHVPGGEDARTAPAQLAAANP